MPLPWFRRKTSDQTQPSPAAEVTPPPRVEEPAPPADVVSDSEGETPAQTRRRRGNRGGRGRKKPGTAAATTAVAEEKKARPAAKAPARERKEPSESRRRSSSSRRRQPPRRAPLPAAKRELLVSVDVSEQRVAVLEDGRVAEVYLERPERRSIAGNIYKGVVDNVLPGMEAAFVEIGLEKNGFLFVDEIVGPELEGRRPRGRRITDLISRGEEVLVQAVKDPMKTKGARLTTEISLPGRFVVYVPSGEGLGVSRRLEEDERNRLRDIVKAIAPKEGGVIVRTAAEGASAEDVRLDLEFLMKLWKQIQAQAKSEKAPALIFQEAELPLRVTRDLFTGDFEKALVDDDKTLKRIQGYLKKTSPHMAERVSRYRDKPTLFEAYGVDAEIRSTLSRRVDLPSGGYLIFDYAEAFTVIDVNTGRFVGSRSKSSSQRLEDTVTKNNLEAVKEVVRQLRLRDIGGIIVIDFIDMANPKNREAVEQALQQELERDRTKTYVVEISPLGLVEMTRQNVTDGPREILTRKCPTCAGEGIVVSEATAVVDAERKLRALAASKPRTKAFKVELNDHVAGLLVGPGAARLEEIEAQARRRFSVVGKAGVGHDHFAVIDEGTVEKLAVEGAPVEEGQTLEVKLVEVGRFDVGAGMAKVDGGYLICVAGAAKLVGKKVNVRIARVLDGTAYALLADAAPAATSAPITAEAQAEKPTRASRAKKPEPEPERSSPRRRREKSSPRRKRTRRSLLPRRRRSRRPVVARAAVGGGRRSRPSRPTRALKCRTRRPRRPSPRQKCLTPRRMRRRRRRRVAARGVAAAARSRLPPRPRRTARASRSPETAEPRRPTIHVPQAEAPSTNGDEPGAAPARKRTRRGSRGGRRHRKPATAAADQQSSDES